jgi:hypothetical protein
MTIALAHVLETWVSLFANHAYLRTAVAFTHIAGLVAGGGCAITADLAVLTVVREGSRDRAVHLDMLRRTHGLVVFGLVALTASGLLLLAADADTYLHSKVFWLKMALVAALVVNGVRVLAAERRAQQDRPGSWRSLRGSATVSLALWTLITLAGSALPNLA